MYLVVVTVVVVVVVSVAVLEVGISSAFLCPRPFAVWPNHLLEQGLQFCLYLLSFYSRRHAALSFRKEFPKVVSVDFGMSFFELSANVARQGAYHGWKRGGLTNGRKCQHARIGHSK